MELEMDERMSKYPALYVTLVFALLTYGMTNVVSMVVDISLLADLNEQRPLVMGCDENV